MSRISSLRSIWTTASSGALLSLIVALCFQVAPAFGQGNYGEEEKSEGEYMSQDGYMDSGMNGDNTQKAALVNVASAVKRPSGFSSVGSVRALLYGDLAAVYHVDFTKIDYEGLSSFLDEVVDKAAGSVRSDDKYSVQLREYQKASLKSSFKKFLSTSQNAVVAKAFKNNFDEFYWITYVSDDDKKLGASVVAVPTDGLDDAAKKKALDGLVDAFEPITVFERYGYIVGVVSHDSAQEANLEPINARYRAKMAEKQSLQSYGAYGSSSNNNQNNGYGAANDGYNALGGASLGGATPGYGNNGQANPLGGRQGEQTNELGLTGELLRDYNEEVADAKDKAKTESRRQVLPRIRNRFSEPASDAESAAIFEALKQTNGAALAAAFTRPEELKSLASLDSEEESPFAGLGSASSNSSSSTVSAILEAVGEGKGNPASEATSAAIAVSLVGSPRLTLFWNYPSAEKAQAAVDETKKALPVAKVAAQAGFSEAVKESVGEIDDLEITVAPLFNDLFDAFAPVAVDTKVAMTLDLEPFKTHAAVFMPLLGGVESKSAKEVEAEGIDWDLGAGDKAAANDDEADEDDPYFDDEEDETEAEPAEDDDASPFDDEEEEDSSNADEDDEEDPWS